MNEDRLWMPVTGNEKLWYNRGVNDEAGALRDNMSEDGRQVFDAVRVLAGQGRSGDQITKWIAFVFTANWSFRQRLALAWSLLKR